MGCFPQFLKVKHLDLTTPDLHSACHSAALLDLHENIWEENPSARQSWKQKMIRLQQGMLFLEGHIFHCCEGKEIVCVWPIENFGNHHAQHDKIVCYGFIHLFHWHACTMIYKYTHDATALSLCQSVVVKDLDFMGGPHQPVSE